MQDDELRIAYAVVEVLRERAVLLGLTQRSIADRSGLSQPRVSRVFAHGVSLSFEVALRLCRALDVTLEDAYADAKQRIVA